MEISMNLKNKSLLITGGTGSFGNAVLRRFLASNIGEIRIFSRDEKKQEDMRKLYANPKLKFYIGDVRDPQSIIAAVRGVNYVFHAAALKQVPSCEFHPLEAVKTNVLGTENLLEAAIYCEVERVICLSTDKAVYPINAMGTSKAMMEKVAVAKSRNSKDTIINITRYGNVMASRGSVIPLFINQLLDNHPITITDPSMTRFMMTLDDAIDLVLYAFKHGKSGEIYVQKSPSATVDVLVTALQQILRKNDHDVRVIGMRHGEKQYETLLSREERAVAQDLDGYFRVPPDHRDLNYSKFVEYGEISTGQNVDYNSNNTENLDVEGMKVLLTKLNCVKNAVSGKKVNEEGVF